MEHITDFTHQKLQNPCGEPSTCHLSFDSLPLPWNGSKESTEHVAENKDKYTRISSMCCATDSLVADKAKGLF